MKRVLLPTLLLAATVARADPPVIEAAQATRSGDTWRIDVTLSHPDTGWEHYADGWRVLAPDGTELGVRVLHHPHVDEQPFTRSLTGIRVPDGTPFVTIEARCLVDGWTAKPMDLALP